MNQQLLAKALDENLLTEALIETAKEKLFGDIPDDLPNVNPSRRFTKKINKLIMNYDKVSFKLTYTKTRRFVCVLVAILVLMLSSLSVGAVRDAVANFFLSHFEGYTYVESDEYIDNQNADDKKELTKIYEISYIPEKYELVQKSLDKYASVSIYAFNENSIFFQQIIKQDYSVKFDSEHSVVSEETIDNIKYVFRSSTISEDITVIWENDESVFTITANLPKNEIIKLCKSLKMAK